ncbi:aminotransferase class IV [Candidatus Peregrinibacteria bacterium]|nr:aminotransferase class IV [Candidatus Peregrinibacteria bacterium]
MHLFLNGKILPASEASISVFDHGFLYGDGIYETLRTVNGEIFDPAAHFERFQKSAEMLRLRIPFSFEETLNATNELLKKNKFSSQKEARVRWSLTRGANDFHFSDAKNPTFLITTSDLPEYPEEYRTHGVSIVTLEIQRILPTAKTISLLPMILGKQKCDDTGSFECLFLENGNITEGTVSNFFIQVKDEIWTAPNEKILEGTAGRIFLKKMGKFGFQRREKLFSVSDVLKCAESAFLTNSLFGILPVTSIDRKKIGDGKVGEVFEKIADDFWETFP